MSVRGKLPPGKNRAPRTAAKKAGAGGNTPPDGDDPDGWLAERAPELADRLLAHYDRTKRDLPWRADLDPYRVWVSEIMLQQTAVMTVGPYFERFLARFPSVAALAEAPIEAVLSLWQGLGYYQRARNLHACARIVAADLGGRLPDDPEALRALPGIGPSTAGAILAIAFDRPEAILDGNVKRVLARLLALGQPLSDPGALRRLWSAARRLTPAKRPGDYAQAIMDLGASICARRRPDCPACPWRDACRAHGLGRPSDFPITKPKAAKPRLIQFSVLLHHPDGRLLLGQRPAKGLLGGLWEPLGSDLEPEPDGGGVPLSLDLASPSGLSQEAESRPAAGQGDLSKLVYCPFNGVHGKGDRRGDAEGNQKGGAVVSSKLNDMMAERFSVAIGAVAALPMVRHTFTHFHLTVHPHRAVWVGGEPRSAHHAQLRWIAPDELTELPISTLHRKVLGAGRGRNR